MMNLLIFVVCAVIGLGQATQTCGNTGRICIQDEASCTGNPLECVCNNPPFIAGDGDFACYEKNRRFGEMRNDPKLQNFNEERVDFPYPCRFMFTHVLQELKNSGQPPLGTCQFVVSSSVSKFRGKFYTTGFDVALRMQYMNMTVELSVRVTGIAANGVYSYTIKGTAGNYLPNGDFLDDDINYNDAANNVNVEVFHDAANNQIRFQSAKCGIDITFVAYDIALRRDQPQVPGLSVGVNCAHHPEFLSGQMVVPTGPAEFHGGELWADLVPPGLTLDQYVYLRAMGIPIEQNQPMANAQCSRGPDIVNSCPQADLIQGFQACFWLLENPRFINCIDDTYDGDVIYGLFLDCLGIFCSDKLCTTVQWKIIDMGCDNVPGIPRLAGFLAGDDCP